MLKLIAKVIYIDLYLKVFVTIKPDYLPNNNMQITQEDRDRPIRLESKFEESQHTLNQYLENIDQPFNVIQNLDSLKEDMQELKTIMFWGFLIIFAEIIIGIILVLWNRQIMASYMKQSDFI